MKIKICKKESDLAKPVANWLRNQGYTVYSEIPYWSRCIDMVGLADENICVVELKLRYSKKGVLQAILTQLATNTVYLAVGKKPNQKSINICSRYGIGLLLVNNNVNVLLEPHQIISTSHIMSKHLRDNCIEPSDNAGLPCMSGCGPAQAVYVMVKDYVKRNPKAGWKEIYNNIPNHYNSHSSLSCAMSGYIGKPLYKIKEEIIAGQKPLFEKEAK